MIELDFAPAFSLIDLTDGTCNHPIIYNKEKTIIRCIDSVLCQSYNDWELIIVDDESTDDSVMVINK